MKKKILLTAFFAAIFAAALFYLNQKPEEPALNYGDPNAKFRYFERKNLSPYAMFGDSSVVLLTEHERYSSQYLEIQDKKDNIIVKAVRFNQISGKISLFDTRDRVIAEWFVEPSDIARWLSVDPKAEKYTSWSPYNYVLGNPLRNIDPNGAEVIIRNGDEQKTFLSYMQEVFGSENLFSFNKRGELQINKKEYKTLSSGFSEDQAAIFTGMQEVVTSDRILETRIFENDNIDFSRNPMIPQEYKDEDGEIRTRRIPAYGEGKKGVLIPTLTQEGITLTADKEDDRAFILINKSRAVSGTFDAGSGATTNPSAAGVTIHEFLDHGLDYVRTGSTDYPASKSTQASRVEYHNRALRVLKSPTRTGTDHE
jgi:hypothetical protein